MTIPAAVSPPPSTAPARDPRDFKAVIFDMDGVIVNSEPYHERAFYEVIQEAGCAERFNLRFSDYVGLSDHIMWVDFVKQARPSMTVEELMAVKRRKIIEAMRREQPVFQGVAELIARLSARHPLALASGSQHPVIDAVLDLRDLRRHFSAVVSASDVSRGKPAPDIFLRAAGLLGIPPGDCWVIEDSRPGVAAALNAGMRVIAVTNTLPAAQLGEATWIAPSYESIARFLLG